MTPRPRHEPFDSDADLLAAVTTGSSDAWATFLDRFRGLIMSCVSRTLVRSGAATERAHLEDVYGEVMLALVKNDYRRLRQYREERGCAPSSWIGLITVSTTLDFVRREKRHRWSLMDIEGLDRLATPVPGPDHDYEFVERVGLLNAAMARCTARDQEFAGLYFRDALPPIEVAAHTGVEVATVYSRRVKLERRLTTMIHERLVNAG